MIEIVINKCFGGFSLNNTVAKILKEKGVEITFIGEFFSDGSGPKESFGDESHHLSNDDFGIESHNYNAWRADKRLIEAIEQIGENKSGGSLAEISIVEIPDSIEWSIDEYDGIESIHEEHEVWS